MVSRGVWSITKSFSPARRAKIWVPRIIFKKVKLCLQSSVFGALAAVAHKTVSFDMAIPGMPSGAKRKFANGACPYRIARIAPFRNASSPQLSRFAQTRGERFPRRSLVWSEALVVEVTFAPRVTGLCIPPHTVHGPRSWLPSRTSTPSHVPDTPALCLSSPFSRSITHAGQQRGRAMLVAAEVQSHSAKKPRAFAARTAAGTSPANIPTPAVRPSTVATYQRTPVTSARARAASDATPRARPAAAADAAARRIEYTSPATHATKMPTPPRGTFPTPKMLGKTNNLPKVVTYSRTEPRGERTGNAKQQTTNDASGANTPSTARSTTTNGTTEPKTNPQLNWWEKPKPSQPSDPPSDARERNIEEVEEDETETPKDFGPPVAVNPFAAARAAAAKKSTVADDTQYRSHPYSHHTPKPTVRVPGFTNLGNTCYLAATAQLLLGLPFFATETADGLAPNSQNVFPEGSVVRAVRELLRRRKHAAEAFDQGSSEGQKASLVPNALKRAVQRKRFRYEGTEQHDAHEFLVDTLDLMEEELITVYYGFDKDSDTQRHHVVPLHRTVCPIRRAFTGESAVTLTCSKCGDDSESVESWRHLSLELRSDEQNSNSSPLALQKLLKRCFAPETVERRCGDEKCAGTHAVLRRTLRRAPKVLLVHLKRFVAAQVTSNQFQSEIVSATERVGCADGVDTIPAPTVPPPFIPPRMVKDSTRVELPERVSLADFAGQDVFGPPGEVRVTELTGKTKTEKSEENTTDEASAATIVYPDDTSTRGTDALEMIKYYKLRGAVSHIGSSMRHGHYTATVKIDEENKNETEKWISFDDDRASLTDSPVTGLKNEYGVERDWYVAAFEC